MKTQAGRLWQITRFIGVTVVIVVSNHLVFGISCCCFSVYQSELAAEAYAPAP